MHNNLCQPRLPFQPPSPSLNDLQRRINQRAVSSLRQMDARMEIIASTHRSVCDVAQSRAISRLVPVLADNSLLDPAVRSQPRESPMPSPRDEQLMPRLPVSETRRRRKLRVRLKAKETKLTLQNLADVGGFALRVCQTTPQTALSSNRLFLDKKNLEWCYKKMASGKEITCF